MNTLTNKVAIITGASSGIGLAAAQLFAKEGAKLILVARRQAELDQLITTLPYGHAFALAGDVKYEACAIKAVEMALTHFGQLDIAFNNAGTMGEQSPSHTLSLTGWQSTLDTNLTSAFLSAKHQLPALLANPNGGSIIFTSSFVGHTVGFPQMAAYAASKAGMIGLTKVLATEYGPNGIRINALLPGGTDTPMGPSDPAAIERVQALHALKRLALPIEMAQAALYLASDASRFTTGTAMLVDGGVSIHRP